MKKALTAETIAQAEAPLVAAADAQDGPDALMRGAAGAVTEAVMEVLTALPPAAPREVLVLVGSGNNGGDGLYAAAFLKERWVEVTVLECAEQVHPRGREYAEQAGVRFVKPGEAKSLIGKVGVIVDALVGIGARGALRGIGADVVANLLDYRLRVGAAAFPQVVAVDIPSGIGVNDGTRPGPVLPADVTVTMGAVKPGLLLPPARYLAGEVRLHPIGLPADLPATVREMDAERVREIFPRPRLDDHKYKRGVLGLITGSPRYPGAARLSAAAALNSGVGMVSYHRLTGMFKEVNADYPEIVSDHPRIHTWVIGSGIDPASAILKDKAVTRMLGRRGPWILDAGAIGRFAKRLAKCRPGGGPKRGDEAIIITPHARELADFLTRIGIPTATAAVDAEPLAHARAAAQAAQVIVLLKGAATVVVGPSGEARVSANGTPWLASAGTGDVLAGLLGGIIAAAHAHSGFDLSEADLVDLVAAGAWIHGLAGRLAAGVADAPASPGRPLHAREVAELIPAAIERVLAGTLPASGGVLK